MSKLQRREAADQSTTFYPELEDLQPTYFFFFCVNCAISRVR